MFVDVGANLGLFTVAAGRRVGASGRVLAFEPGATARRRLMENVCLNALDNVSISAYALSDASENRELTVPQAGLDAFSSLARPIVGGEVLVESVSTRTWLEAQSEFGLDRSVTMMKIDVEGWELRVLRGAKAFLERADAPLLQVEFGDLPAESAGGDCAELYAFVRDLGFDWCRYDAKRNRLVRDPLRAAYPYANLFATRDIATVNQRLASHRWLPLHGSPVFTMRGDATT